MTRFDDDSEWHESSRYYKEGTEAPRREARDTKKRSKSDATNLRNTNVSKV